MSIFKYIYNTRGYPYKKNRGEVPKYQIPGKFRD